MASRRNPGGCVISGAGGQEENIFRRTDAHYANMYGLIRNEKQYPLDRNFGGIYSPKVTVFRGSEDAGYPLLDNPFHVAVITVAALNRPELTFDNKILQSLIEPTKHKMRTILRIALVNGHDAIVLGAFGCGAFKIPRHTLLFFFMKLLKRPNSEINPNIFHSQYWKTIIAGTTIILMVILCHFLMSFHLKTSLFYYENDL